MPCYTFKNMCVENAEVNLNDNTLKVIYNASAYESEKDEKVRKFLHFVCTNKPEENDEFSNSISALVEQIKHNEEFRSLYAAMNLHDRDLTRMVRAAATEEKAIEAALVLIKDFNLDPKLAAEKMNAPLDKVLKALSL